MSNIEISNYKLKYIKYKMKYNMLLKGGWAQFKVLKNDGSNNNIGYSNQCIWLSILAYINNVLSRKKVPEYTSEQLANLTLPQLKAIASANGIFPINEQLKEFDDEYHHDALMNILKIFKIKLVIYPVFKLNGNGTTVLRNESREIINDDETTENIVSVVSYGAHFELITEIRGKQLYKGIFADKSEDYIPVNELVLGTKGAKLSTLKEKSKIELLFEHCSLLGTEIENFETENKSIDKKLEEMDLIINSYPQQIAQYDTERKAIIESCQEYKKTLLNSKKINDTLLDSIKKQKTDIESRMNNLLS